MTKQRTLRLSTRNLRHANRPTQTIHILTATPAAAVGMVQGQATIHRAEDGNVVQIPKQEKTQAKDGFAPTWPYSTSVVQADVYCLRRVSLPSFTRFARDIRSAPLLKHSLAFAFEKVAISLPFRPSVPKDY